ncbi:MAG: serine--tRNA ligase [Planctomycetota bacterium]|jgi:seryl-tRNA synthetase
MLDIKYIAANRETVRSAIRNKGEKRDDLDEICALHEKKKTLQTGIDGLRHEVKQLSKEYGGKRKAGKDDPALMEKSRAAGDRVKKLEEQQRAIDEQLKDLLAWVPNVPADDVPVGDDPSSNRVVREWGEKRTFGFAPRPHWDIASDLDIVDFERAPKVAASNFLLFKGAGARLERALISFMLDVHTKQHGYTEIAPPFLAGPKPMFGSAQIPKLEADMYRLRDDDLYLIPTAEVPLTNLHGDEILSCAEVPKYYTAHSACFRREAGAYGRETRGMLRIHQFDKVEILKLAKPEDSPDELESLLKDAEKVLQMLGLPYRVVLLCTGDMSFASAKTYDIEVWAPGIERWLEVSSCTNFTDFQARRCNLRFRGDDKKVRFVHTVNGSGVALPRTVIALLETFQQEDGSVEIPAVLRPYLDGTERITK